jgi:class I fructose-bisphosphate aldolase
MTRYQLASCYMGRSGLINSGGASRRQRPAGRRQDRRDQQAARPGNGPDLGAQGLPAPLAEGIELLNAIQDVYLAPEITVA